MRDSTDAMAIWLLSGAGGSLEEFPVAGLHSRSERAAQLGRMRSIKGSAQCTCRLSRDLTLGYTKVSREDIGEDDIALRM